MNRLEQSHCSLVWFCLAKLLPPQPTKFRNLDRP